MNGWIITALILVAVVYGGLPLLIYFTQRMKGRPELRTLTEADLPPQLTDYLYSTASALREDGFRAEGYLRMPEPAPNMAAYLILMANRETGDKAMVTIILGLADGAPAQITAYVEFSTKFSSGAVYNTMNSSVIGSFDPHPGVFTTQLWMVQDPRLLYRIHRFMMTEYRPTAPGDVPVIYPEGTEISYLRNAIYESYEKEVARGILRPEGSGDDVVFRPTFYGAFKMTWRQLVPFSGFLKQGILSNAQAVLRAYETSATAQTR